MDIADRVLHGDAQAIARAITLVEQQGSEAKGLIAKLHEHTGNAKIVGLTGAPGVGKSTLVSQLVKAWRSESSKVGVIAVDPTSPFTGGAILGDRIRLQEHASDVGVFVRSMATRGHLGGLAPAVQDAVVILDAAGNDIVAIETVGVGQAEVDVSRTADACIVITVPGTGDDVQAIKAGVMEIADIFAVNKSDRDGADRAAGEIEAMLTLRSTEDGTPRPSVVKVSATLGHGIDGLISALTEALARDKFRANRARVRAQARLEAVLRREVTLEIEKIASLDTVIDRIVALEVDPYTAAYDMLNGVLRDHGDNEG